MTDITDPRDVRYTDCWPLKPGRFNLVGQRKPKALIALQRAETDAWAEVTRLAEVQENSIMSPLLAAEIANAVKLAVQAQKRAEKAHAHFYANPDAWWGAEDAADTREAYSGYQGVE